MIYSRFPAGRLPPQSPQPATALLLGTRTSTAARQARCKVSVDCVHDGVTRARAPALGNQLLQIPRARYVAAFDQHRAHVGRLENPKAGGPIPTLGQAR